MDISNVIINGNDDSSSYLFLKKGDNINHCDISSTIISSSEPVLVSRCALKSCDITYSKHKPADDCARIIDSKIYNTKLQNVDIVEAVIL